MFYQTSFKKLRGSASFAVALAVLTASAVVSARAHEASSGAAAADGAPPILWETLGTLHYAITANPEAQKYFDQGLRLAYAFNHEEARRSFHYAQELDPNCALCYWGEALVLGPNINAPMNPNAVGPALAALAKARTVTSASQKEKDLIAALAARYSDDPKADRLALDAAYGEAMVKAAASYPDDTEISVLAAEALMDVQPWDYWAASETGGAKIPKGRQAEINTLLERVLNARPDHPGAIHYYIHLWEASDTPERAEPYADRIGSLMPGAGHLVHMASHIHYRVGRYADSIRDNKAAAAADEAFLDKVHDHGIYGGAYYPHNVHFVLVSAQMAGDGKTAIEAAQKLASVVTEEAAATVAWVQPIMLAPYWAHAQYSPPDTILGLPDPGDTFPFVKGMWHYARGVALAAKGELEGASAEADAIDRIANTSDLSFMIDNYIPADQLLQIARHVVLARIAQHRGYANTAIDEFSHAAALQAALSYMEPPYWYYPVRQSLGAALLKVGRAKEAVSAFEAALKEAPNNGWAIYGLQQARKALGDDAGAKTSGEALSKAWIGSADLLDLSKL